MMSCSIGMTMKQLLLLVLVPFTGTLSAQFCNVCREPPPGGFRDLANPSKSFSLKNGKMFTCQEMKDSTQDIRVGPLAAPGEKRICATAQYIVAKHCECDGTPMPPLEDEYEDLNPACKLCLDPNLDNDYVPLVNYEELTETTEFGALNCKGLAISMSEGTFAPSECGSLQESSAEVCCNFYDPTRDPVNSGGGPAPGPAAGPDPTNPPGTEDIFYPDGRSRPNDRDRDRLKDQWNHRSSGGV